MKLLAQVTLCALLIAGIAAQSTSQTVSADVQPTPTPWGDTPATDVLGHELVDLFRIENTWPCGGSAHACLAQESDALVLTRIAFGESASSLNDRIFIMWLIRLRAALGYKSAGYFSGYRDMLDRWGEPTSIKTEALCVDGCQFTPARAAQGVYFPCFAEPGHIRSMLCPSDDELADFFVTYLAAQQIVDAPLTDFPSALRGYDGFRSPSVVGVGRKYRLGGLPSAQFWPSANIYLDEQPDDNLYWETHRLSHWVREREVAQ